MGTRNELEHPPEPETVERYGATPLRPAIWMTGVLVWATVVALILRVPTWAGVFLCALTGVSFLVFLVGYVYLFINDRQALRAERWRAGSAGAMSRDVPDQQEHAMVEDRRGQLGPERAQALTNRPDDVELRVRVTEGERRTAE